MKNFFLIGGIVLALSGILQAVFRPRRENESTLARFINASVVRAILFVMVGALAVLLGTGYVPLPQ